MTLQTDYQIQAQLLQNERDSQISHDAWFPTPAYKRNLTLVEAEMQAKRIKMLMENL